MDQERDAAAQPPADAKERFREALARKQGRSGAPGGAGTGPQVHPHTAPAKPQKTFRRKSG